MSARVPSVSARLASRNSPAHSVRGTVLLVDDDMGVRASLSRALESEEYMVIASVDGTAALRQAADRAVDVVLLDLGSSVADGWELFRRIASVRPQLPIIVMTARQDQYKLAASAGATAIIEKPLSLPILVEAIDALLHGRSLGRKPLVLTPKT